MKKIILSIGIILSIVSCSSKEEGKPANNEVDYDQMAKEYDEFKDANQETEAPKVDPAARGLALIEGSDCLSCHKVNAKLIGPAYQEVAAKYTEADIDKLADKIINGGKGVWGEIPMTPHPDVDKENAKQMVKYILSLKK